MGFVGSERTTRRVVARLKADYVRATPPDLQALGHRAGPVAPVRLRQRAHRRRPAHHACSAPGWPGPAFGSSLALADRTFPSLVVGARPHAADHRGCADLSAHRQREDGDHQPRGRSGRAQPRDCWGWPTTTGWPSTPAWWPTPSPRAAPRRRCASPRPTCLPRPDNLVGEYADFASFERACAAATDALQHPGAPRDRRAPASIGWRSSRPQLHRHPARALHGGLRRDPDGVVVLAHLLSRGAATRCPTSSAKRWSSSAGTGDEVVIVATGPRRGQGGGPAPGRRPRAR